MSISRSLRGGDCGRIICSSAPRTNHHRQENNVCSATHSSDRLSGRRPNSVQKTAHFKTQSDLLSTPPLTSLTGLMCRWVGALSDCCVTDCIIIQIFSFPALFCSEEQQVLCVWVTSRWLLAEIVHPHVSFLHIFFQSYSQEMASMCKQPRHWDNLNKLSQCRSILPCSFSTISQR